MNQKLPEKTVERLSLYKRVLNRLNREGDVYIFSHQLASMIGLTPAQVRRDLMLIGQTGNSNKGYQISKILDTILTIMFEDGGQKIALSGIGNLGRAILAYFMGRTPKLSIVAAFDVDIEKIDRVISGCKCYHVDKIKKIAKSRGIEIGIITVPASQAQKIADQYVSAGIKSIINWSPVNLELPPDVFLVNRDITMSIEKAAYFAKKKI